MTRDQWDAVEKELSALPGAEHIVHFNSGQTIACREVEVRAVGSVTSKDFDFVLVLKNVQGQGRGSARMPTNMVVALDQVTGAYSNAPI